MSTGTKDSNINHCDDVGSRRPPQDTVVIWPTLFFTFCCICAWFTYFSFVGWIISIGFLLAIPIGLYGVVNIFRLQLRRGLSFIGPILIIFAIIRPPLNIWTGHIPNIKHHIRFMLNKNLYESEIQKMKRNGIRYKEWPWGFLNADQFTLIYDESDQVIKTDSTGKSPCSRKLLILDEHFYVADDFCE